MDGARGHACLEVHWEVVCRTQMTLVLEFRVAMLRVKMLTDGGDTDDAVEECGNVPVRRSEPI